MALLRAAAFPLEKLAGFGDPSLAARAVVAKGATDPGFTVAYAAALQRERLHLRSETIDDTNFMKALVIANPQLARAAACFPGPRAKKAEARARRLHGALFRHLSRAVGRTEPADLWAGVAMTDWVVHTVVEHGPKAVLVHPDLRPFQAILRDLSRRPRYVWSERWRANATLARQADGRWRYSARRIDGQVVDRITEPNAIADVILPQLPHGAFGLQDLATALSGSSGLDRAGLEPLLESYVRAGVLVGGLDLPARFSTPWEALERAGSRLGEPEASAWRDAVNALRRDCVELGQRLDVMTTGEVTEVVERARLTVLNLAAGVKVDVVAPRSVLRCDVGLGLRVRFGPDVREQVAVALGEHDDPESPATGRALRRRLHAALRSQVGAGMSIAQAAAHYRSSRAVDLSAPGPADPSASTFLPPTSNEIDAAPMGCLLVSLESGAGGGPSLRVRGVFDEVSPLYARFARLWGDINPAPKDPLYRWLRRELETLASGCRLRVAELAGPCEANPNALAAPPLTDEVLELWGTTEGGGGLVEAEASYDPVSGALVVRTRDEPGDAVLFSFCSADVARGDRVSELLLASSGRLAPAAYFEAPTQPHHDGGTGETASRPALPSNSHVRPRRVVLNGEALDELLGAEGAQRYVRWQQLAVEHRWPALVRVRVPGAHALLMPTTSPLAVEAVLGRVAAEVDMVVVEDSDTTPWLSDTDGAHYVSELAVPFGRIPHVWSARAAMKEPG